MSLPTGITPSANLIQQLSELGDTRAVCVRIESEALVGVATLKRSDSSWKQDLDRLAGWLTGPCFILTLGEADKWVLFTFIPDDASVRDKMLYSASKQALVRTIGDSNITENIFCSAKAEISSEGFERHLEHKLAAKPLTEREMELAAVKLQESQTDGTQSRRANAPGIAFPLTAAAINALKKLSVGDANFVSLKIDKTSEVTDIESCDTLDWNDCRSKVDGASPRFIVFKPALTFIFAYICPPSAIVKERMWYSASRQFVLSKAEELLGISIKLRVELDSIDEFTSDLMPKQNSSSSLLVQKQAFAKPTRPKRT